jgi:hypothetical protein
LWLLRCLQIQKHRFVGNVPNFSPKSKVKISKIGPNCSLRLQQLWTHKKGFPGKFALHKKLQIDNLTSKTAKISWIDNNY